MSKQFFQNKYNEGDIISATVNPSLKLIIRRYIDQVYYCRMLDDPEGKELVYYEREIVEDSILEAKNKND